MNKFWGISILIGITAFFGKAAAKEEKAVLYAPQVYQEEETLASAKYIDENNLNFDDLTFEEDSPSTAVPPPAKDVKRQADMPTPLPEETPKQNIPERPLEQSNIPITMKSESLTDVLQQKENSQAETTTEENKNSETQEQATKPEKRANWSQNIKETLKDIGSSIGGGQDSTSVLENLVDDPKNAQARSNAAVFDISGVMLRMDKTQVEENMKKRGYQKVKDKYDIPNFIRWRNEETCRNSGVIGYERLQNCVVEMAKKNNYQYLSTSQYAKYKTKEEIIVRYTSNFSGNKVYKISYKSMAAQDYGTSPKATYLRNIKIYDFWKQVNRKYGVPDNKDDATWGLGNQKSYLQAATGMLVLEDPMLRELDFARMAQEDQKFMNTGIYSF